MEEYGRDRHDTAEVRTAEWERLNQWLKSRKRDLETTKKDDARKHAEWLRSLDGNKEPRKVKWGARLFSASKDGGTTWTAALPASRLGGTISLSLGGIYYHCAKLERRGETMKIKEVLVKRVR